MAPKRKPSNKSNNTRKNGKRPAPIQQPRVVYPTNNGSRTHKVRFNNLVVANNGNAALISNNTKRLGNGKAVFSTGKSYVQLHPFLERESGFPYLSVHENAKVSNSATLNKHGREELQTPIQLTNPQHFIELQHILGRDLTHNEIKGLVEGRPTLKLSSKQQGILRQLSQLWATSKEKQDATNAYIAESNTPYFAKHPGFLQSGFPTHMVAANPREGRMSPALKGHQMMTMPNGTKVPMGKHVYNKMHNPYTAYRLSNATIPENNQMFNDYRRISQILQEFAQEKAKFHHNEATKNNQVNGSSSSSNFRNKTRRNNNTGSV